MMLDTNKLRQIAEKINQAVRNDRRAHQDTKNDVNALVEQIHLIADADDKRQPDTSPTVRHYAG